MELERELAQTIALSIFLVAIIVSGVHMLMQKH
jgi:hypothetical protein